jgi:oligopeptide/dipeptide ABC transporter ATP-binding protein
VLDEPTSALDVTVQARVLALIGRLREERSLAYLLISHNLAVVERLCEWTAVLYLGCLVEEGPTELLLNRTAHPYTQALRAAVPDLDQELPSPAIRAGEATTSAQRPSGCRFHPPLSAGHRSLPRGEASFATRGRPERRVSSGGRGVTQWLVQPIFVHRRSTGRSPTARARDHMPQREPRARTAL